MTSRRRTSIALLTLAASATLLAPTTAVAQDVDDGIIVTSSGRRFDASECALPIAITEIVDTAQPADLTDPRNPLGFPTTDPNTAVIRPVQVGAVTLIGDFGLPPENAAADSGCADFWDDSEIIVQGDGPYFETAGQWTGIGATFDGTLEDIDDQAYREFTFLWDVAGLPAVDAAASGLPDLLDGASEGAGYSNNLGEITNLLFRGNGVGADNFGNPLTTIGATIAGDEWLFVFTPRPDPARIAATSAAEQLAESVVVVETAQPVIPVGPTTLEEIAARPGFELVGGSGDDVLDDPEPTTTPAPSTTSPPETTEPPATTSSPETTEAPATTESPATTTPPQTEAPAEEGAGNEGTSDDAGGDGGSVLPILIILVLVFGVVAVLMWLLLIRPGRSQHDAQPEDGGDGHRVQDSFRQSVVGTAIARGESPRDGWVHVTQEDVENTQSHSTAFVYEGSRDPRLAQAMTIQDVDDDGRWQDVDTSAGVWINERTLELSTTDLGAPVRVRSVAEHQGMLEHELASAIGSDMTGTTAIIPPTTDIGESSEIALASQLWFAVDEDGTPRSLDETTDAALGAVYQVKLTEVALGATRAGSVRINAWSPTSRRLVSAGRSLPTTSDESDLDAAVRTALSDLRNGATLVVPDDAVDLWADSRGHDTNRIGSPAATDATAPDTASSTPVEPPASEASEPTVEPSETAAEAKAYQWDGYEPFRKFDNERLLIEGAVRNALADGLRPDADGWIRPRPEHWAKAWIGFASDPDLLPEEFEQPTILVPSADRDDAYYLNEIPLFQMAQKQGLGFLGSHLGHEVNMNRPGIRTPRPPAEATPEAEGSAFLADMESSVIVL